MPEPQREILCEMCKRVWANFRLVCLGCEKCEGADVNLCISCIYKASHDMLAQAYLVESPPTPGMERAN